MTDTDKRLLLLAPEDNVVVARAPIAEGETVVLEGRAVTLATSVALGHKLARRPIRAGEPVVKYGAVIGTATEVIAPGTHVHLHNLKSNYTATHSLEAARAAHAGAKGDRP
ncbi:MAG: UxaA family hydrolase [Paracoccaceae bacterium]